MIFCINLQDESNLGAHAIPMFTSSILFQHTSLHLCDYVCIEPAVHFNKYLEIFLSSILLYE